MMQSSRLPRGSANAKENEKEEGGVPNDDPDPQNNDAGFDEEGEGREGGGGGENESDPELAGQTKIEKPVSLASFVDLREAVRECSTSRYRDCPEFVGHPATVLAVAVVGLVVFVWGLVLLAAYLRAAEADKYAALTRLWWQTTVGLLVVTVLSLYVPWRIRCELNVYTVVWVALLLEYAVFVVCFPKIGPPKSVSHEELAESERRVLAAATEAAAKRSHPAEKLPTTG